MKTTWFDQLLGAADEWLHPWASVTPDPAGEADGGGGNEGGLDDDDSDLDGLNLDEGARGVVRKERKAARTARRELQDMKTQLEKLKDINPDAYRQLQTETENLRRQLETREQALSADRRRIEEKAQREISNAKKEAEDAKQKLADKEKRDFVRSVYEGLKGDTTNDELNLSAFDAYMAIHGNKHFQRDTTTGKFIVVDSDGDPIKNSDGNYVDPKKWLDEQADKSSVIGRFFPPKQGSGGGGLQGARGVRGIRGLSIDEARAMKPGDLLRLHNQS